MFSNVNEVVKLSIKTWSPKKQTTETKLRSELKIRFIQFNVLLIYFSHHRDKKRAYDCVPRKATFSS